MRLSVIIPAYNAEETIAYAIESVLYQNTNFDFELIVYDDCSTDKTRAIAESYSKKFPRLKLYSNTENIGNAKTFYNSLQVAKGKYFHVLDADDYFTNWNKLQRQVDFLDANPDYCAVAHGTIYLTDNSINIERINNYSDRTYDYIYSTKLFSFYYHTSSYMYKNVFLSHNCGVLQQDFCRGDVVRMQLVRAITNEKVKILPLIASVYNFNGKGIWSSMTADDQKILNLDFMEQRCKFIFSGQERRAIETQIKHVSNNKKRSSSNSLISMNACLDRIYRAVSNITYKDPHLREVLFQNCNYFPQADELMESIGRICLHDKRQLLLNRQYDDNKIVFLISGVKDTRGGGIIKEILEFIQVFLNAGKSIFVCSTEQIMTELDISESCFNKRNMTFIRAEGSSRLDKINFLIDKILEISPARMYPYITHNDVIGGTLIQKHLAREVIMSWVYDHGTSLAVSNSSITNYIAKTNSYHYTLKSLNPHNKICNIPVSFDQVHDRLYIPFKNHIRLITATAAARSYKVETQYNYSYIEVIPSILQRTGGHHYHYGPLTESFKLTMHEEMARLNIDSSRFIHIEWVDGLALSMITNEVDVFISSFPVGSARIAVEVNSIGIPILAHHSINRLFTLNGFISTHNPMWENTHDIFSWLESVNPELLTNISIRVRDFYENNNSIQSTRRLLLDNKSTNYDSHSVTPKSFVSLPLYDDWLRYENNTLKVLYRVRREIYRLWKQIRIESGE
jgi:glycosyltransferase involved in cell wall biosynthesis